MPNPLKLGRKPALAAGVVVLAGISAYFSTHWNHAEKYASSPFRIAPDFTLPDASGKSHRLSELRGNLVLLHFWASWCPPCLGEIPTWVELADVYKGRPLKLVAVSMDDSWQAEHKVLPSEKVAPGILVLLDPKSEVADRYGSYAFPETYLISPKGEIITKWIGAQEWKSPEFLNVMNQLLDAVEKKTSPGAGQSAGSTRPSPGPTRRSPQGG